MGLEKKMKIGFNKLTLAVILATFALPSWAAGTIIAVSVLGLTAGTFAAAATAFAINMVISAVITKAFFSPEQPGGAGGGGLSGDSPNPGNRQQLPPATDNKLPVVYGEAYLGGQITDLSISANCQEIFYVIPICEVTNNGADTITFGDVYWGGKKCIFAPSSPQVESLLDESTGLYDNSPQGGYLKIYLYNNGSFSPVNSSVNAISVMQTSTLTYKWDSTKLMTNTAFAIIQIVYNQPANLTGIQQTKFQVFNSRHKPGDCFYDYLTNDVYGAAIPAAQVNTASLTALNTYSDGSFSYTTAAGGSATQTRFRFDGVVDTNLPIMDNLQYMANCCDCLLRFNEITSEWGVITQSPTYSIAMALNDSNMVSAISISPLDIAASYNVVECKFPDNSNQDAFNSTTFDLAQIDPSLLYPNEPVNKQSVSLPLVNNDVRAQYLAIRMLKESREDLQVQVTINFQGIQLEAGDIVTVTNANYGWVNKEFRVMKVTEDFASDGSVTAKLSLSEFNAALYDDEPITQFQPSPNTGIPDPLIFSTVPAPSISTQYPIAPNPLFLVNVTSSASGVIQYAEVWYSAFPTPTSAQLIFAGTTEIKASGLTYDTNTAMPPVSIANIPQGNWYFFSRMVNNLGSSPFSPASAVFEWRPSTFQYVDRYLAVAYADSITGTGFSFDPRNKSYYGLRNQTTVTPSTTASDYTWYLAEPTFGTTIYLTYSNRGGRKFSFDTGFATYAAGTGAFVPSQASIFDPRLWAALPDGTNYIDLDYATGQVLQTGTTTTGTGEIDVTNNPDGKIIASLKQYLDFGSGIYQKTASAATLTIDIYGRVVGFELPDDFYFTKQSFTATSGQTVFSVTRNANYISGQCLVFQNGSLLDTSEYTDTGGSTGTVTLSVGATLGDVISIISFRSTNSTSLATTGASGTGSVATLTFNPRPSAPFGVGQSITVAGVTPSGYNGTYTVTACTTTSVSYANTTTGSQTVAGTVGYTNGTYKSFTRNTATLTNASSFAPTTFSIQSGYEFLFISGVAMTEGDYDIVGGDITNLPSIANGLLTVIQWSANNLSTPNGNPVNAFINAIIGQTVYPFSYDSNAFNLYLNGVLLLQGTDYTTASGGFTLANAPTTNQEVFIQQTFARTGAA